LCAAVARGFARCASQVLHRGAQADDRGATHLLDLDVKVVARGAARRALHVHGRGARTDACGRTFALLSTQVSTAGLRMRYKRLTRGSVLEVSRNAAAAEEEQLVSCAAKQGKCSSIYTVTLDPYSDLPFTSWGRWQCLRGGADVV
jgi:hypothetical protein